jgi:uncharacterized surface protein with fasciclin (FAS1) repeats
MNKLIGIGLTAAVLSVATAQTTPGTIVDVASANSSFTTLVTAVKAGDLVATLSGRGPFTVFAPTNEAFAKLPAGTVENLVKPENKATLVKILTYHVVAGEVPAATVVTLDGKKAKTVQGGEVTIAVKDGKVSLTDEMGGVANVTATDVKASNGLIHVIDRVLMPK